MTGHKTVKKTVENRTVRPLSGAAAMGAGPGRPPGMPNKQTKALKDMILGALDAKGGQEWLEGQMDANPGAFLTLIGKVLPTTIQGGEGAQAGDVTLIIHAGHRKDEK